MKVLCLLFIFTLSAVSLAEKMNLTTHNLLIDKLSRVLETLNSNDASKEPVTMRLADLYAERARLYETEDGKAREAREDRLKGIELYEGIFKKLDKNQKSKVLSQMAHLYELTEQSPKALQLYKSVTTNQSDYSPMLVGQAYVGLGEMNFNKVQYKEAQENFQKALSIKETQRRGYVTARLAWCYFHRDKLQTAVQIMRGLLKNPELLPRTTENRSDISFREEVSRDYATFISKTSVGQSEINSLSELSPPTTRKDNLVYLATELDRLGKKIQALAVWKTVGEENKAQGDDLEEHFHLAQLNYDVGKRTEAVSELELALGVWKTKGCKVEENCKILKSRMRKLITDWAASEERAPTPLLIKAYTVYLSVFPDLEMQYWAAGAARAVSQWRQSISFYRAASAQAKEDINKSKDNLSKASKIFEGSCLGEIEVAELSKDPNLRMEAYNHYLSVDPKGPKNMDVRYQKAHLSYEQGQFAAAAEKFHDLALDNDPKGMEIREKAADISIESTIASKNDTNIEIWAAEYSKIFPKRSTEFLTMSRNAVLNHVAANINNSKSSTSTLEKSLSKLNQVSFEKATTVEKTAYYKNKIILAEKLQDLTELDKASDGLMSVDGVSAEDYEFALSRKAWVAELRLNFELAYELTRKLKMSEIPSDEKLLKLAMLAELAGKDPDHYYREYIKVTKNREKAGVIMAKLVRTSSSPETMFRKYESSLKENPELYATLALEIFSKTQDYRFGGQILKSSRVRSTQAGHMLSRFVFLKDFNFLVHEIVRSRLAPENPRSLRKSYLKRLALLKQIEQEATRAIASGDWTLQVVTLDTLERQYSRLAQEVVLISPPQGLGAVEKAQYKSLLTQQAEPFAVKAREISAKMSELWKSSDLAALVEEVAKTKGPLKKILAMELKLISNVAPHDKQQEVAASVSKSLKGLEQVPSHQYILEARESVKENPFNVKKIENLKNLEERAGQDTIVSYLDSRLVELQGGRK